ncbi:hypothetical protein HK414_26000 [Ramlibacter terrae]|uniref:Uncharacterized protein n=1 Tax=Ramlibacter terrae TaxID=2732511 RepID=A0ABX6P5R7_9BURK|nr:hypothetical protein HK414_26000 [Ramlibacter terrae]
MFKAKFAPGDGDRPRANAGAQGQQQQQPQPTVPPIEKERGPQHPIKEPGPGNPPERAR